MIADQLLQRIEYIHYKSFIHRDIKPDVRAPATQPLVCCVHACM